MNPLAVWAHLMVFNPCAVFWRRVIEETGK